MNRFRSALGRFVLQNNSDICYYILIGNFLDEKLGTQGQVTCLGNYHKSDTAFEIQLEAKAGERKHILPTTLKTSGFKMQRA